MSIRPKHQRLRDGLALCHRRCRCAGCFGVRISALDGARGPGPDKAGGRLRIDHPSARAPPPSWTTSALSAGGSQRPAVPFALSAQGTAVAVVFDYPLRAGHPIDPANNICGSFADHEPAPAFKRSSRSTPTTWSPCATRRCRFVRGVRPRRGAVAAAR